MFFQKVILGIEKRTPAEIQMSVDPLAHKIRYYRKIRYMILPAGEDGETKE